MTLFYSIAVFPVSVRTAGNFFTVAWVHLLYVGEILFDTLNKNLCVIKCTLTTMGDYTCHKSAKTSEI